jgi:uncharacterized protein (TIGR02145 family)
MKGSASSTANPSGVQGVCPTGWHLPSDAEWTELTDYLGGEIVAGSKIKATGTVESGDGLWYDPNSDATNESCFTTLPGGIRNSDGDFVLFGVGSFWWSSSKSLSEEIYVRTVYNTNPNVERFSFLKQWVFVGLSVRCVKD